MILAAGEGKRLSPLTKNIPKSLITVGDKTILEHIICRLQACGVTDLVLVVGFLEETIREKVDNLYKGMNIKYVSNTIFYRTNNIYSLWLARNEINDDLILINGDDLFSVNVLKDLLDSDHPDAGLIDDSMFPIPEEAMKVTIEDGLIRDISKEIPPEKAHGNAIGVYKFSLSGAEVFFHEIDKMVRRGRTDEYYLRALQQMIARHDFHPISTSGSNWIEIDDHADLMEAEKVITRIEEEERRLLLAPSPL